MRKLTILLAGIIAGSTIGAAVSLLFTPASGDEMREGGKERFRHILDESARAAAARRAELEADLAAKTGNAPKDASDNA